jgi:DNA invertase Pin-like site-specific DNA recombinase
MFPPFLPDCFLRFSTPRERRQSEAADVHPQSRENRAHRGRPGLKAVLDYIRADDCLVVWKLDRLGRSLPHLIQVVTTLREEVAFRSLTKQMDTTTAHGDWRGQPPGMPVIRAGLRCS